MNANLLFDKILEKNLPINETLKILDKICDPTKLTIEDALWIKSILMLTNLEAIDIFLS